MSDQRLLALMESYLGLESFEVTEELLELCGADLDTRALPVLKHRLQEEEGRALRLEQQGYIRMAGKKPATDRQPRPTHCRIGGTRP